MTPEHACYDPLWVIIRQHNGKASDYLKNGEKYKISVPTTEWF